MSDSEVVENAASVEPAEDPSNRDETESSQAAAKVRPVIPCRSAAVTTDAHHGLLSHHRHPMFHSHRH